MEKCSMCSKKYPEETMKKMVQVMDKKAYAQIICPVCYHLAGNNPNYYHVTGDFSYNKTEYDPEWLRVIDEAKRNAIGPETIIEIIQVFGKANKKRN